MLQLLLQGEFEELRKYAGHLLEPDRDRALLLTAHLVTEWLLGAMIETALMHPEVWIDDADYRSKVNLARAMGLIGDKELAICRVLNSARNAMAHALEPLPEKWKVELERLAFGSQRKRDGHSNSRSPLDRIPLTVRFSLSKLKGNIERAVSGRRPSIL